MVNVRDIIPNGRSGASDDATALREQVKRYQALLLAVPAYSYTVTLAEGRVIATEHGPGCRVVTGYAPEDYLADPLLWISMVHPDDRETVRAHAAAVLAGGPTLPLEHRINHRDGRLRWVRNTVVPHRDAAGRLDRYDGLVEDITERRQAEQALREGERMKAIGALAASVAHRFNMVTEVVAGSASSLVDRLTPDTEAYAEAHRILEAARHAGHLTQRLMSVARMSETGEELRPDSVSAAVVIRDTIEMMESTLDARNIRVTLLSHPAPLFLRCNASQLVDALMNLFLNSAEAMPNGGAITVDISERTTTPRAPAFAREGPRMAYGVIRVRDTGAGIGPEVLGRIFEPFFTTQRARSAFGLGLTVVKSIVHGWGGGVSVRSRKGAGASFRLFLPKATAAQSEGAGARAFGRSAVLLVDDDPGLAKALRQGLERAGYQVYFADSPDTAKAVHAERAREIAVSVIDVIIPGGASRALVEGILKEDSEAKVILTSGFSRDFVRGILPHGAWSFLQKPFDEDKLVRLVNDLVSRGEEG